MCQVPDQRCQEISLLVLIITFCLLSAPLRGVLHHVLGAGSPPLSFILTQKEAVKASQQTPPASHSFSGHSQSKNTEPLHPACVSQQAEWWMCWHLLSLSHLPDIQVHKIPRDVEKVGRALLLMFVLSRRIWDHHMKLSSDKFRINESSRDV